MNIVFETERLYHRQFIADEDAFHFFSLNNDPAVIKYTGDKAFADLSEAQQFMNDYKYNFIGSNKEIPIGRWAMIRKNDLAFLGWCGLRFDVFSGEIDLGYRLYKNAWGQNYATESAKGCLKFGFEKLNIPEIIGRAMHENKASIRVLEKCGMKFRNEFTGNDHAGVCYAISKEEFNSRT